MSIHVNSPKFSGKASSSVTRKETESTTHLPVLSHLPSTESILIPKLPPFTKPNSNKPVNTRIIFTDKKPSKF
jgi:hypothetical protein